MARCAGIKRDGGRCTTVVEPSYTHCYQHDPDRAEERRRNASRAARSKPSREIVGVKAQLRDLARDVLAGDLPEVLEAAAGEWAPTLALYAAWDERRWRDLDGVFVEDSPLLSWVADDGRRRGDDAPVLVAHSSSVLAAAHLDDPAAALEPMLAEVCSVLEIAERPRWAAVQRWSLARPLSPRPEPFFLGDALVGLCGDGWHGRPRVESAYLSGLALGRELAARLTA